MARTPSKGPRALRGQMELVMSDAAEAATIMEHDVMGALDAIIREAVHTKRRMATAHTHVARAYKRAEAAGYDTLAVTA